MSDAAATLTLRQLYRSMRPEQLIILRMAFVLDAQETDSPICRAFCEERMALIGEVLREKRTLKQARARRAVAPEEAR